MSTTDRIGLATLAVACATGGVSVAAVRPDWPGVVTWFVVAIFLAGAAGCIVWLGQDVNRKRHDPAPQSPPPSLPVPYTGPVAVRIRGGGNMQVYGNRAYGAPVLDAEDVDGLDAHDNISDMRGSDQPEESEDK